MTSGGRCAGGTLSQPMTRVCGENPTKIESNDGTAAPK